MAKNTKETNNTSLASKAKEVREMLNNIELYKNEVKILNSLEKSLEKTKDKEKKLEEEIAKQQEFLSKFTFKKHFTNPKVDRQSELIGITADEIIKAVLNTAVSQNNYLASIKLIEKANNEKWTEGKNDEEIVIFIDSLGCQTIFKLDSESSYHYEDIIDVVIAGIRFTSLAHETRIKSHVEEVVKLYRGKK